MRSPYATLRFAKQYDRLVRARYPVHRKAARLLVEFAAPQPGQTVLDLGAGTGLAAELVLRTCQPGALLLVDAAAPMLTIARSHLTALLAGRVGAHRDAPARRRLQPVAPELQFIVCDAARLPEWVAPGSVDVVIASYVFGWLRDPQRALAAVAAVLKPGGTLVFDVPPPAEPPPRFLALAPPFQVFSQHFRTLLRERLGYTPPVRRRAPPPDYAASLQLAQAAGLGVVAELREEAPYSVEEVEAVWHNGWWFSAAANPALWRLPAALVEAVAAEAVTLTQASPEYRAWRASGEPLWETYAALKVQRAQ